MCRCCDDCFDDHFLKKHLREHGGPGKCAYCEKSSEHTLLVRDLADLFAPVVGIYDPVENFMWTHDLKRVGDDGMMVWERLQEDWQVFASDEPAVQEAIIADMFHSYEPDGDPLFLSSFVQYEPDYAGASHIPSREAIRQWNAFREDIMWNNRYHPRDWFGDERFADVLRVVATGLEGFHQFFRARIEEDGVPYPAEKMGAPPPEKARANRANPPWIPYLYLASSADTAIAEVRPGVGDNVCVAIFTTTRSLHLVDLRDPWIKSPFELGEYLRTGMDYLGFLRLLGEDLSRPVNHQQQVRYVPLQYLCETIKLMGHDGLIYNSAVAKGYNMVLFDPADAEAEEVVDRHQVTSVHYASAPIPMPSSSDESTQPREDVTSDLGDSVED